MTPPVAGTIQTAKEDVLSAGPDIANPPRDVSSPEPGQIGTSDIATAKEVVGPASQDVRVATKPEVKASPVVQRKQQVDVVEARPPQNSKGAGSEAERAAAAEKAAAEKAAAEKAAAEKARLEEKINKQVEKELQNEMDDMDPAGDPTRSNAEGMFNEMDEPEGW